MASKQCDMNTLLSDIKYIGLGNLQLFTVCRPMGEFSKLIRFVRCHNFYFHR